MSLAKRIDGALVRAAAYRANDLREAIMATIDPKWIADRALDSFPEGITVTSSQARVWATMNILFDNRQAKLVLDDIYAAGWVLGQDGGAADLASQMIPKAAHNPTEDELLGALGIDWDSWTPGHRAAEALVRPPQGLQEILTAAGQTIKGLNNTTVSRIGTVIADALGRGASNRSLAKDLMMTGILGIVDDPARALTIATTEMSRAMNLSTMNYYAGSDVDYVKWIALEPCDICEQNADAGPIQLGQSFPSGANQPPAHPHCRCTIRAVFDFAEAPVTPVDTAGDITPNVADDDTFVPGRWTEVDEEGRWDSAARAYQNSKVFPPDYATARNIVFAHDSAYIKNGVLLRNGNITIRSSGRVRKVHMDELLKAVEELQTRYPKDKMLVSIGTITKKNAWGSAYIGDSHINLKMGGLMDSTQSLAISEGNWKMPSLNTTSQMRYTLAHEWGHSIDVYEDSAYYAQQAQRKADILETLNEFDGIDVHRNTSAYGRTMPEEMFAELFAEWYLTGGKTTNPVVLRFAERFGW